ncbi:hypothetical protein ALC62_02082 [Cyphomyrmex costatus]|uniref:Uncharacterized protein n=1 Tax=Cyphomyrmex costatus TaxID=456900 RepID=A0A151INB5_9HYME|nr:hypothetical protein ALC62_02082 [Cyphomyrmex costatus]
MRIRVIFSPVWLHEEALARLPVPLHLGRSVSRLPNCLNISMRISRRESIRLPCSRDSSTRREIWRSSGAVPRIRICINRPLSRGWFIESSGGVCRYIERRICNSSCPGLGNHYDKVAEDTDIKGEGEVIPRRSSEMPEN